MRKIHLSKITCARIAVILFALAIEIAGVQAASKPAPRKPARQHGAPAATAPDSNSAVQTSLSLPAKIPDKLPSGESADAFLIRQVGGGFAELTTDTQKKKPLQLLMEEIVLLDGRDKAPGKWIDDIPDDKPAPLPDIAPRLTTMTLYYDREAVNTHWDAFNERYKRTASYLNTTVGRPLPPHMPGDRWEKWGMWVKEIRDPFSHGKYPSHDSHLKALAGVLLYVDFLQARGYEETKKRAFSLLCQHLLPLNCSQNHDQTFSEIVMVEMVWPMLTPALLNPEPKKFMSEPVYDMWRVFSDTSKTEELRFQKWFIKNLPNDPARISDFLARRANKYIDAEDYTGALFCDLAFREPSTFYSDTVKNVKYLMDKRFGPARSVEYYRRFLECVAPVSTDPYAKNELAKITKQAPRNAPTPIRKK